MLHAITKRLEIYIDINTEISEVDHYMWIFTSRIFRLALEMTVLLNKYFFSYNGLRVTGGGPDKRRRVGKSFEKNK